MPVAQPPLGGPLGRSRNRLSASALTTYLRCESQWFLAYQVGLHGPLRPSQVAGIVLEDALCELFMMHPPHVSSKQELTDWANPLILSQAKKAHDRGREDWDESLWREQDVSWDDVTEEDFSEKIRNGFELFMEEVEQCYNANGGPFLETRRGGGQPFSVPEPTWGSIPVFPRPEKVPDVELRQWDVEQSASWSKQGEPVTWNEAWECARPWVKDPRVHQPQRLYHPDGWASGELDLVLRWDGNIRIVDIKSGSSQSSFASSLEHQLRFYSWLWAQTHEGQLVEGMEGWYLSGPERIKFTPPTLEDISSLTDFYMKQHQAMQGLAEGVVQFPSSPDTACSGEAAGCYWCQVSRSQSSEWNLHESQQWISELPLPSISSPYAPLSSIQGRVSVKGSLSGAWGPLPNHFSEPVLGAVLVGGTQHIALEESEPGSFPKLHEIKHKDVLVHNALPGVWRDQPRLYVDNVTQILPIGELDDSKSVEVTRLGLLRTRANVKGYVLSIRKRSGRRIDGKPWSMVAFMLWDGSHVAEVVAFGNSINQRILNLKPGSMVAMTGVEIGWRSGLLQLRIDSRKTRLEPTFLL
ncbi:MAG: hypothetical protein CMA10_06010 [Euryarchaeota archaeon]|nr:hypothetical protein [Euryarchaeota archaeon]